MRVGPCSRASREPLDSSEQPGVIEIAITLSPGRTDQSATLVAP
jgi:hypothetical protein